MRRKTSLSSQGWERYTVVIVLRGHSVSTRWDYLTVTHIAFR